MALPPGFDTSHRQGGSRHAVGNPLRQRDQHGNYTTGENAYYRYDPSGKRYFGGPGPRDSLHGGSAYNYQDSMTPEQRARQDAAYDRAHYGQLQASQQQKARNYAAGYRNEGAPGQRMPGFLPGGQHLTYNARSGNVLSAQGGNVYEDYPMQVRPRPVQSPGVDRNAARVGQSHWDRTWGAGNLLDPNNPRMSTPDRPWWETRSGPTSNYRSMLGGY